ncbi:MAG: zinc-ribbon domain-containing protein [Chloroflexi bacterium]|nr:zinc-ribbon domain-containing protein [Chloroflexota bacterium]
MDVNAEAPKMPQLKDCPKCGRSNMSDARYCEGCGASLKDVVPQTATPEKKKGLLAKLFGRES